MDEMFDELLSRFLAKVVKCDHGCWLWIGAKNPQGYGKLRVGKKTHDAHRVAYRLFKEKIPKGLYVTHSCDNPSCVNPDHLFAKTQRENSQEAVERGLLDNKGEKHYKNKFSEEDAKAILASVEPYPKLAERYGVSKSCISSVKNGYTWKYLTR
jgi:hypothetical protein